MRTKRIISLITMVVFITTVFFSSAVNGAEAAISEEKLKLMIAAGEIPPTQQITEESVKIKRDRAIEIARTTLENPSDFETSGASLYPEFATNRVFWSVNFYAKGNGSASAGMSVDANSGEITGFNLWNNVYGQQNYVASFTKSEALVVAKDFMQSRIKYNMADYELVPEDSYMASSRMGGVREAFNYNFLFAKKLNGILMTADTVYIGVDGTSGKVTSFNRTISSADINKLPSPEKAMAPEKAMEKYKESTKFNLQYMTQYDSNTFGYSKPKVVLAYIPGYYADLMDAEKGVFVNYDGSQMIPGNINQLPENPVQLDPKAVLPSGAAKTDTEGKVIAVEFLKRIEKLLDIKFDNSNLSQQIYESQNDSWLYSWNKNVGNINYYANISVNKTTGRISNINFNKYDGNYDRIMMAGQKPSEIKEKITWSMGKKKAIETVKQLLPEQYGFFMDQNYSAPEVTADAKKTMREHSYSFVRLQNGIPFRDNTVGMNIDRETGAITSFYMNWSEVEFPKTDAIITKATAAVRYFEGLEPRLQYLQKSSYDQVKRISNIDPIPMLVYSFARKGYSYNGGVSVDALTGKLMDYNGREVKPETSSGEAVPGDNWSKRSVELLTAQGIIKDSFVDYSLELTRGEAVKMLSSAKGITYYPDYSQQKAQSFKDVPSASVYYPYVENAVKQGIIEKGDEFKADEKITKEEFSVLLVKMTGYSGIADKTSIFKSEGLNVTNPANVGYIAVCSALDFLPVKPGEAFAGSAKVTMAEASSALYKALKYIR